MNDNNQPSTAEHAAIVLLSMGEEHAAEVLRGLPRADLMKVTHIMSELEGIKLEQVRLVLQNFFQQYGEQSGVRGASRIFLQRSLDLALGKGVANDVLNSLYGDWIQPKIARLQWVSPHWIATHIAEENLPMQALFLAYLPADLAGAVLAALPASRKEQLLLTIAKLDEIDQDLLIELDALVEICLRDLGNQGARVEGPRHAANIINRLPVNAAALLASLREQDTEAVDAILSTMYDFNILIWQSDETIGRIIELATFEEWAVALQSADPKIALVLRRAMPRRQVQAFDEAVQARAGCPRMLIEKARENIMGQVKTLATDGQLDLRMVSEEAGL